MRTDEKSHNLKIGLHFCSELHHLNLSILRSNFVFKLESSAKNNTNELCLQMALEAVPMASTVENLEKFLFSQFPSRATFTTKDYEKDGNQTTPEAVSASFYMTNLNL